MSTKYNYHDPDGIYFSTVAGYAVISFYTENQQQTQEGCNGFGKYAHAKSKQGRAADINYYLFDKDHDFVDAGYAAVPTNASFSKQRIAIPTVTITKPGYIYIFASYSSNTTNYAWFDDLKVTHKERLSVVQADDYYPFGMQMSGLGYKRGDLKENRYLYNAVEHEPTTGQYETAFRNYDAALGRFGKIDPLAGIIPGVSPYHFAYNNPVKFSDPLGLIGEQDIWGRDRYDSFTGMYIPPMDRPGGMSPEMDFSGRDYFASRNNNKVSENDIQESYTYKEYGLEFYKRNEKGKLVFLGKTIEGYYLVPVMDAANGGDEFNWGIPIGAAGTATSAGVEYAENMVRTAFKTGRNPVSWSKLTPSQQAWRTANVLGKNAKYVKYAKGAGVIGTGISVGMAGYDIASGQGTTIDYLDVGVGTASIGAAIFLASNPVGWVIGAGAAVYFAGRLVYDIYEEVND
jgi:RHS repeat-associated protein